MKKAKLSKLDIKIFVKFDLDVGFRVLKLDSPNME